MQSRFQRNRLFVLGTQIRPHVRSSRHVRIERKHSNNASEKPGCAAYYWLRRARLLLQATSWSLGHCNFDRFLHTASKLGRELCSTIPLTTPPRKQSNGMYHTTSAIIPRGGLRQRGDRLLVIRAHPFLLTAAGSRRYAQCATSSGSRTAIFYFPLGPVFDLSLCRALLFSTSSLCFTISYFTTICASARGHGGRERHCLRPRLILRDIACPKRVAVRRQSPPTAPASHSSGVSKIQLPRPLRVWRLAGFRGSASRCG
jgi:hypothetical protein